MPFHRRILYGPQPEQWTGSLSDRAIAGCWFELRRLGGCGDGELKLKDAFPDRGAVQIGDWIACEYDVDDRWYLGRVVERIATSPAGVVLRLEGMVSELERVFPGGYGSDADGEAPRRYGCTDLFPADPDHAAELVECVDRPDALIQLLLEQFVVPDSDIAIDTDLIDDFSLAADLTELKVRGTETAAALIRDLGLLARNASWGVDEYGRFYLLGPKETVAAEWQEGRDLVALRETADDRMLFNRILLTGGLVYADCDAPPCGVYRWQGNYLQPDSRALYGERRIRVTVPWVRTPEDSQSFVREFFRVYAVLTPRERIEVAGVASVIRPWLDSVRVLDRDGNELASGQPEIVRVQFDHAPRLRIELGPIDPRTLWTIPPDEEVWPIAPSDVAAFGGGPIDVTSDASHFWALAAPTSDTSTSAYEDCWNCAFAARRWKVTLRGITAALCDDCAEWNGEHILERDFAYPGCVWTKDHAACDAEGESALRLYRLTNYTYFMIAIHGGYEVKYRLVGEFDGNGPNTFELDAQLNHHCHVTQRSLVIEPA
jgi:hypothetical protein